MLDLHVSVPHTLKEDEAYRRIKRYLVCSWRKRYVNEERPIIEEWPDDTYIGKFKFFISAIQCRATITVLGKSTNLHVRLFLPLPFLGHFIEDPIKKAMRMDLYLILHAPDSVLEDIKNYEMSI